MDCASAPGENMRHFPEKHAALFPKSGRAFSQKMQRFRPRGAGERTAGWGAGACAVRGNCVHLPPNQPARWGWAGSYLSVKRTFQAYLPSSNFATSRKNREETATGASALDVSSCAPGREPARHLCDIIWTWAGCALPILGKGNAKAGRWDRQEVQNPTSFVFRSACAGSREFCRPTMKVEAAPWYTSGTK